MKTTIVGHKKNFGSSVDKETGNAFSWDKFMFWVTYHDKKEQMSGDKTRLVEVKTKDLSQILGLGLKDNNLGTFTDKDLDELGFVPGSIVNFDFNDQSLIDIELLS